MAPTIKELEVAVAQWIQAEDDSEENEIALDQLQEVWVCAFFTLNIFRAYTIDNNLE